MNRADLNNRRSEHETRGWRFVDYGNDIVDCYNYTYDLSMIISKERGGTMQRAVELVMEEQEAYDWVLAQEWSLPERRGIEDHYARHPAYGETQRWSSMVLVRDELERILDQTASQA